jgi:hypothetical protein
VDLAPLNVRTMELPFDLEEVEAAIEDAERELNWPRGLLEHYELHLFDPQAQIHRPPLD